MIESKITFGDLTEGLFVHDCQLNCKSLVKQVSQHGIVVLDKLYHLDEAGRADIELRTGDDGIYKLKAAEVDERLVYHDHNAIKANDYMNDNWRFRDGRLVVTRYQK